MRTPEASRFVGLSIRTLEKHRIYGTGPRYSKLGGRVVYRVEDLQAWSTPRQGVDVRPGKGRCPAGAAPHRRRTRTSPPAAPLTSSMTAPTAPAPNASSSNCFGRCRATSRRAMRRTSWRIRFFPRQEHRTTPIDYRMNEITVRVEGIAEHGMRPSGMPIS